MTFSSLASGVAPSHGKYSSREGVSVQYLIVHHWAGTAGGDARLVNPNESVSASYILYGTGALIGQVPEEYRPWTSGSWNADAPAVTVETQNSASGGDWPVTDAAVEMLAQLAADLCRRYGWGRLDRSRVRGHREFASTACPGPYLWARLDAIVARGNQIIEQGDDDMYTDADRARDNKVASQVNSIFRAIFEIDVADFKVRPNGIGRELLDSRKSRDQINSIFRSIFEIDIEDFVVRPNGIGREVLKLRDTQFGGAEAGGSPGTLALLSAIAERLGVDTEDDGDAVEAAE